MIRPALGVCVRCVALAALFVVMFVLATAVLYETSSRAIAAHKHASSPSIAPAALMDRR